MDETKNDCIVCRDVFGESRPAEVYYTGVLTGEPVYLCAEHANELNQNGKYNFVEIV